MCATTTQLSVVFNLKSVKSSDVQPINLEADYMSHKSGYSVLTAAKDNKADMLLAPVQVHKGTCVIQLGIFPHFIRNVGERCLDI